MGLSCENNTGPKDLAAESAVFSSPQSGLPALHNTSLEASPMLLAPPMPKDEHTPEIRALAARICEANRYHDSYGDVARMLAFISNVFADNTGQQFQLYNREAQMVTGSPLMQDPIHYLSVSGTEITPAMRIDLQPATFIPKNPIKRRIIERLRSEYPDQALYDIPDMEKINSYFFSYPKSAFVTSKPEKVFRRIRSTFTNDESLKFSQEVDDNAAEFVLTWNEGFRHPYLAIDIVANFPKDNTRLKGEVGMQPLLRIVLHHNKYDPAIDDDHALSKYSYKNDLRTSLMDLLPILAQIALDKGYNPCSAIIFDNKSDIVMTPDWNDDFGFSDLHAETVAAKAAIKHLRGGLKGKHMLSILCPCHGCAHVARSGFEDIDYILEHTKPWSGLEIIQDERINEDYGPPPIVKKVSDFDTREEALGIFEKANKRWPNRFHGLIELNRRKLDDDKSKARRS